MEAFDIRFRQQRSSRAAGARLERSEKSRAKLAVLAAILLALLVAGFSGTYLLERLGAEATSASSEPTTSADEGVTTRETEGSIARQEDPPSELSELPETPTPPEPGTVTCEILLNEEWVEIPCDDDLSDWLEPGPLSESTGSSNSGSNSSTTVRPQPSPADDSLGVYPGEDLWENLQPNDPPAEQVWCPEDSAENPELYQACWEGFVAPDFVLTGLHSCFAGTYSDDDFGGEFAGEPFIQVVVRIEIVGGNYRDHNMLGQGRDWDGFNRGYTLRSKSWLLGPNDYELLKQLNFSIYAEASFYPMRDSYNGDALVGYREAGKWIYDPILTSDLPGDCWPPNR